MQINISVQRRHDPVVSCHKSNQRSRKHFPVCNEQSSVQVKQHIDQQLKSAEYRFIEHFSVKGISLTPVFFRQRILYAVRLCFLARRRLDKEDIRHLLLDRLVHPAVGFIDFLTDHFLLFIDFPDQHNPQDHERNRQCRQQQILCRHDRHPCKHRRVNPD